MPRVQTNWQLWICLYRGECCDGSGDCETLDDGYNTLIPPPTAVFSLNTAILGKIEGAINSIPNVNVNINKAEGTVTSKKRDCCDSEGVVFVNGQRYKEIELTLSAEIKDIPIWGRTVNDAGFDWGFLVVTADAKIGVWASSSFSIVGLKGKRWDDCGTENCVYGSIGGNITIGITGGAEAISCIYVSGSGGCTDIVGTISGNIVFGGTASWDLESCAADGDLTFELSSIGASATFTVDGVGLSLGPWNVYP